MTYQASGDNSVVFELRGSNQWVGVGFSDNNLMVSNVDLVDLNNCINIYIELKLAFIECFFQTCLSGLYFFFYRLKQTYLFAPAISH